MSSEQADAAYVANKLSMNSNGTGNHDADDRPLVYHDPRDITSAIDGTIEVLMHANAPIWQQDGTLVHIKKSKRKAAYGLKEDSERLRIVPVKAAHIRELATDAANHMVKSYYKHKEGKMYFKPDACPTDTINDMMARPSWPFDELSGIVTVPTPRHDGSLIVEPGYDHETGLYYAPSREFPTMPTNPTKDDAIAAYNELWEPFQDFWFAKDWHESAAIAAVLTLIARHLLGNVPAFPISSETRGIGKGLLAWVISMIGTGQIPALSAYPKNDEEFAKQLLVIGLNGDRVVVYDNVSTVFGGSIIDMALTASIVKGRILGLSKDAEVRLETTFIMTGNHLRLRADTARRVIPISLTSEIENPEERTDFTHGDLKAWVSKNQPRLLAAALTILRAYIIGGKQKQQLTQFGSFEEWSDLVRSAIVWLDKVDPWKGRKTLEKENDAAYEEMRILLHAWSDAYPNGEKDERQLKDLLADINTAVNREDKSDEDKKRVALGEALTAFDHKSEGKILGLKTAIISRQLKLNEGKSRIIDGLQIHSKSDERIGTKSYWVHKDPKI